MINKSDLNRLSDFVWEIPAGYRDDMRVPARIYGSDRIIENALKDASIEQLVNTTTLPGLVKYSMAMPDIHQGYGFPIGGVAASRTSGGVISPGGVGYDINCGVRLLSSGIDYNEAAQFISRLISAINRAIPSGTGKGSSLHLKDRDLEAILSDGARWMKRKGHATTDDIDRTESGGRLPDADPGAVSSRAFERGIHQMGSLGSGNHFIEIDLVDEIYDAEAAAAMGLIDGMIAVQIHTGSRGFGHQICTDYLRTFQGVAERKYGMKLADRQLMCVPFESEEGQDYFAAMCAAANFAFANRQMIAAGVRRAFESVLAGKLSDHSLHQVYDIAHNIAKVETHDVDGRAVEVVVHRKGATRAFGPGAAGVPRVYKEVGQPVLVPGSMGTASWVLAGTEKSMRETFGSSCHGAGRTMSRKAAKKAIRGDKLRDDLEKRGISVRAGSMAGLAEEAPGAYKDVDEVVRSVTGAGITKKVARLVPLAVVKG